MSSNGTPQNPKILLGLARAIHAGQVVHEGTVGLMHHLAAGMDAAIKLLIGDQDADAGTDANKGSQLIYREAVKATGDAQTSLMNLSDNRVKPWLDGYRKVMEGVHGKKANDGWTAAGFAAGSTAVPRSHEARHTLLAAARGYLATHPEYEASLPQGGGPNLAVTDTQAQLLFSTMQTAFTLIGTRKNAQTTTKATRDGHVAALYDEVSGTISELGDLLEDDDARWELFGLNIPADPHAPEGVATLTITAAGAGRELAAWVYAVRAEYYRVFLKRVGIDADFINVADARDLEYTLKGLTAGSTIELFVVPMNEGGAGAASPTVSKVVGA